MGVRGQSLRAGQSGQAAVEFLALLPVLLFAAAVLWQAVLTGHGLWLCANAARVAARAALVGADPESAARSALPDALEADLGIADDGDGRVEVTVRVPLIVPSVGGGIPITSAARLGAPG